MKLLVLYTRLSGYMAVCLKNFRQKYGAEILVYAYPTQESAPFAREIFEGIGELRSRAHISISNIDSILEEFTPDAVLVSGWADKEYVAICRKIKAGGITVISGCDTQWRGSARQIIASLLAPWYVHRFIDILWVSGERQRQLAEKLGYHGSQCWDGYYACDWQSFASREKENDPGDKDQKFLFIGRYVPEKGIDILADAYQQYCNHVENPWSLICAGAGPLRNVLITAGAEDRGFVQPSELPALMKEAAAFVLPSRFEPWGVVVQEAAASGLPLVLSSACGAGVHLLRPFYNGFLFETGSVSGLFTSLLQVHNLSAHERGVFGQGSYNLSLQYTPQRWAEILWTGYKWLRNNY